MKSKEDIKDLLEYFQLPEDPESESVEDAILTNYQKKEDDQSLAIKILSVFGGILASLTFTAFLFISGLANFLVVGAFFIMGAVWISRVYHKIIIDTLCISFFIIGLGLLGFGLLEFGWSHLSTACLIFIGIALGTLWLVQNYMLAFVAILTLNGSLLFLILDYEKLDWIHAYIAVLTLVITCFFLKEAKIVTIKKLSPLYNPIRIGLVFSFLFIFVYLGIESQTLTSFSYAWIISAVIILVIVYVVYTLLKMLSINKMKHRIGICALCVLLLLPTALSPAISGALLIILLSFLVNYKTGFALGVIAFIYFISRYYYDLHFTLLTKSILMFSSGVLFIAFYLFIRKKLTSNEKI